VSEDEAWQSLLRDALAVLALAPEEQVHVNGPGCVACDLLENFDHGRTLALANPSRLSKEQRELVDRIDSAIQGMEKGDVECGNDDIVRRPVWQQLRQLAAEALRSFGWQGVAVAPFQEVQPGVWQRPLAK
jgi:hypothetical protein